MTERDIVKSIAKGVPPDDISAGSLMSSYPILSIKKDQPIEEAAFLMIRNKVRHLLVEDVDTTIAHSGGGGRIIGMITTADLAAAIQNTRYNTASEGLLFPSLKTRPQRLYHQGLPLLLH